MRFYRLPLAAAALFVAVALVASPGYSADDPKAMHDELRKLADEVAAGKDIAKAAEAFAKKHGIEETMVVFKPRLAGGKGGLGIGKVPGKYTPDGIEGVLLSWGKKAMTKDDLKTRSEDLTQAVAISAAMAEVTKYYAPKKPADAKKWDTYNETQKKANKELLEGIKKEDPMQVKAAMNKLTGACNECHTEFRN